MDTKFKWYMAIADMYIISQRDPKKVSQITRISPDAKIVLYK